MKNKTATGALSSLLVSNVSLIIWLALSVIAIVYGKYILAVFLLFLFLLAIASRIWGACSMHNITVDIQSKEHQLFVGGQANITYSITNDKFLPLVWLELCQLLPINHCLWPENNDDAHPLHDKDFIGVIIGPEKYFFKKRFAFVLWHQNLQWTTTYIAQRRGIYTINDLALRSGDGLGLTQIEQDYKLKTPSNFVIYPQVQAVATDIFMRNMWQASSGAKGHIEDTTVIKGLRDYSITDSWKRINWRMAARQQPLQVNMYETVRPKSAHFILDGESFYYINGGTNALEDTISMLTSILLRLKESQIDCGLSLPRSLTFPETNVFPQNANLEDLLFYLSGYELQERAPQQPMEKSTEKTDSPDNNSAKTEPLPEDRIASEFDAEPICHLSETLGQVYYIASSISTIENWDLLQHLDKAAVTILTYEQPDAKLNAAALDYKTLCLCDLKRGGNRNA